MIKIENVEVLGWEHAIRGMRNPKNSWDKSDSNYRTIVCSQCEVCDSFNDGTFDDCDECDVTKIVNEHPDGFMVGPNDHKLMMSLAKGGPVHAKYRRMIAVYADITAPLYWWKEFDTYKVGTVANSCSTMHKIHAKEIEMSDFSIEHLDANDLHIMQGHVYRMEANRKLYLATGDKVYWNRIIQLLPTSYNQKRTVMLNYEVLTNIYESRRHHKLDEWHVVCDWIEGLPYSEIITGDNNGIQ